jgi:hypothetical protein
MKRKVVMRMVMALAITFFVLKWTGVIKIQIPQKFYYVIIAIGFLELCGFAFIGIKLWKARKRLKKEAAGAREQMRKNG